LFKISRFRQNKLCCIDLLDTCARAHKRGLAFFCQPAINRDAPYRRTPVYGVTGAIIREFSMIYFYVWGMFLPGALMPGALIPGALMPGALMGLHNR
jgi:hypothetical protein